jgi:CheY-like chemotaxis protein
LNKSKTEVVFFVKDTGIGIPKDRQVAIFERFIQADIEDKMALQGAGLGLAISRAYVELLKGKIWLESEVNVGSTFFFTLPYRNGNVKEINNADLIMAAQNQVKNLKILIADDDEISNQLIAISVKEFAAEIVTVISGKEAIEVCKNNKDIDLVLMDIQMPVINGYEATRQIREFNKNVIIIAQTAFALAGDSEKSIVAGCNDYISKPIKKVELETIIQKHFKEYKKSISY